MFHIGQQVLYGIHGVCSVLSIETQYFGNTKADYYVLQPISQTDSRYYIPVGNPAAVAKLQPLLTRQEILDLLHSEQVRCNVWIQDEKQRKACFREILIRGDRAEIMSMIYCLHRHKKELQHLGKKFHQIDETFLKEAEKLINAEFSHVLGLDASKVSAYILKEMDLSAKDIH